MGSTPQQITRPDTTQWAVAHNTTGNGAGWNVTIKEYFDQPVEYTSIIDVGSVGIRVPTKYYNDYLEKLKKLGISNPVNDIMLCHCEKIYRDMNMCQDNDKRLKLMRKYPDLELTLEGVDGGDDVKLSIPTVNMEWNKQGHTWYLFCKFQLRDSGKDRYNPGQYFLFGDSSVKGHVTTFDYANKRIGFAEPINKFAFGN